MPTNLPGEAAEVWDVLVLGAGMAGLGCARVLAEAGLRVCVVEAKAAVGGRMITERVDGEVMELGAEFVHGSPPELLALLKEAGLGVCERRGAQVSFADGRLESEGEDDQQSMFAPLERLRDFSGEDMTFAEYLGRQPEAADPEVRGALLGYVEGFNAADSQQISARSLGVQQAAEDAIDGDRVAHVSGGYDRLPEFMAARVRAADGEIRCGVAVDAVHWGAGRVAFETNAGEMVGGKAVITLPLGVLQAGTVRLVPAPSDVLNAATSMRMGQVCRFTMLFRECFWATLEPQADLRELSFLFDFAELPSVWWTTHPEPGRTLTGWIGGPRAEAFLGKSEQELRAIGVRQVARIFGVEEMRIRELLVAVRTHDWSADERARGAYSYVGVGGLEASARMSEPVEHTLFFAGEHTDTTGHWGTVHGALRSGLRAARQVLGQT